MFEKEIKNLLDQINSFTPSADNTLPQNAFFLNDKHILCLEREKGVSRYPYDADGLNLWGYSSGHISANESRLHIFRTSFTAENPCINFFGGLQLEDGSFYPVALQSVNKQLVEPIKIKRYVVYSLRYMYYIADTDTVTFAVRLHISRDKHIHFAFTAINKTDAPVKTYLTSYIEPRMFYANDESNWDKMHRFGKLKDNGSYVLYSRCDVEHINYMVINQAQIGAKPNKEFHSVSKGSFLNPNCLIMNNTPVLLSGELLGEVDSVNTTNIAAAVDIAHYTLDPQKSVRREYDVSVCFSLDEAERRSGLTVNIPDIDADLEKLEATEMAELNNMNINFGDWKGSLNPAVLNRFIKNVQKQISFCAMGKNYAGVFMGIRDVFQQLESSLIWQPQKSREKIITSLNYILEDGRPPRQYSVAVTDDLIPPFDTREFIDQGAWIISTVYTYLSYTDDWSILKEKCSYYVVNDENEVCAKSTCIDSALEHLIKITDFMGRNLDEKTGCLRVLFGDWNDALDGMGKTDDEDQKYGDGVSVMASLQYYQNCREMCEILAHIGGYDDKIARYKQFAKNLEAGLKKYAVDVNEKGERRIIHGWGDKMSYKVCSFNDPDGVSRYSSTANSFWALSGMIERDPSLKKEIMDCFNTLKSKYGLLTFDKPFGLDIHKEIGRLATITPGTAENCCTYVHAAEFAAMALFCLGEGEFAWDELQHAAVISHDNCSLTSFVMPNSYCYSKEFNMDGETMAAGDWYTGSGTVFIKAIVKYGFGVAPVLDGLMLQTAAYMPCNNATLEIKVKGHPITLKYENRGEGNRRFEINGKAAQTTFDTIMNSQKLFIKTADLTDNMVITVID